MKTICFILLIVSFCLVANAMPEQYHYPVMSHDGAGGDGPKVSVFTGGKEIYVTPVFLKKEDEYEYHNLGWCIKFASGTLNINNVIFSPPAVYFIGSINSESDSWGRPTLLVSSWYLVSPFLELESEGEGLNLDNTAVEYYLTPLESTEGTPAKIKINEKDIPSLYSKYTRCCLSGKDLKVMELDQFVSLFPVLSIDIKSSTVEILSGQHHPLKTEMLKVVFTEKNDNALFFSKKNQLILEKLNKGGNPPSLFLIGKKDKTNKIFKAVSWRNKPLGNK